MRTIKQIFIIFFLFSCVIVRAQEMDTTYKYVVFFKDKNHSSYTLDHPEEFLSEKAINRRAAQGIPLMYNDLPVSGAYIDSILSLGVTYLNRSKWMNFMTFQTTDTLVLNRVRHFPFVSNLRQAAKLIRFIKKNVNTSYHITDSGIINDRLSGNGYSMVQKKNQMDYPVFNYGKSFDQVHMLGGDVLHSQGYSGEGVIIAVLDAGFYKVNQLRAFDSLWINQQILAVKDFVEPWEDVFTKSTHGEMVLSIIAGNLPGQLLGTAPKASFFLLRSEDAGSETLTEEYNWVAAAEFADSAGADIISSSLGYTTFDDSSQNHTYATMNGATSVATHGARTAAGKGILVVNSAGNSGDKPWRYIGAPADADSILACGAVGFDRDYAPFSSLGPTSDGRIKPDVSAMGYGTYVASPNGGITSGSGTSFSAPLISGMCACLWQANPQLSNIELIHIIKKSCDRFTSPDNYYGYGIPNFSVANLIAKNADIYDITEDDKMNVFPNPFYNNVYIMFKSSRTSVAIVELFNVNGERIYYNEREIMNPGYNSFVIDRLDHLSDGLYFIRLTSGDDVIKSKVLKKSY